MNYTTRTKDKEKAQVTLLSEALKDCLRHEVLTKKSD